MLRWRNLLDGSKAISFHRASILAISIVLIRMAILAAIKDREIFIPIDDVIFAIGSGLAAIGLLYGASNSIGRTRKAWMVLAIAQIVYALGDVSWAVIEAGLRENPFPSVADVFYLAFYPIFALGIFLLPTVPLSSRERIKFLLDAGIVVIASIFLFWVFMIAPIIASNESVDLSLVVSVAYPVMDLVVLAAFMELIFRKLSFAGSKPLFLLAFGLVIWLIADVIFSIQTQAGTYVSSSLLDTLWLISDMLFLLAGVMQANSKPLSQPTDLSATYNKSASWTQYLPYLAIGATSFLLVWSYENTRLISYSVMTGFIAAVIGLAFMRQKVTIDESNQLLATTLSQMQELNLADEALQESEDRYHSVVDQASDIIFLYDLETKCILEGNLAFHRLLGYSIEDIAGLSIYDIVAHDRDSIDSNIEKIKEKKRCYIGQRNYRKKDGSLLDVEVYVNLLFFENESILCSIARDITDRKRAEDALRKSEQEKTAVLDGLKNVSVEYLDPQMHIIWLNNAVQKHLGLSEDEIKGKCCFEVIQGIESSCPGCTALKALQTARPQEGELTTPDGKVWISHSNVIKNTNGDLVGVVHVAVNITERKMAEEALQESENRYRTIFENTGTATIIIEDNTIISLANSEVEKLSGYSKEEIEGKKSWTEFVVKDDLERMTVQHKLRRTGSNAALNNYEFRAIDRYGNVKNILLRVDTIPGTKKSVASLMDITELKLTEKALQESENMYRAIFENTGTAMVIDEDDTLITLANSEFARLIGYSREEIEGKISWTEFVVKEDLERMLEQHKLRRIDPGAALRSYEFQAIDKNGHIRDILLHVDAIPRTRKSVASMLDITERNQMEKSLRESKEQYKILAEASQDMIYVISRDDKIVYVNGSAARGLGPQHEEIIGSLRSSLFPPDVAYRQKLRLDKVFETGLPVHSEDVMIVGGMGLWQDTHLIPLKTDDNEIYAILGISRDITERKHAEEALRDSESKLASIIDFLPDATLVIDSEKKIIAWNRAIEEMTGVNKDDMIGKGDYAYTIPFYGERRMHLLDLLDLDDNDLASKYRYVERKGKILYAETYTPALYGGKGAYVMATGAPLFDNKGNRIGAIESIRDITEFKKAERTLREQLNFLQQLIDSIPNPIFYKDTKGVYLGCNTAFEAITGYLKDNIVGYTVYELYPKELAAIYYEADNKLFQDPGVQMYESSMAHTDGSRHDVMFSKATYFDTEGRLAGLVGVILDITDRKHMETALKESERRLTDIINFLPDATLVINEDRKVIAWNRSMEALTGIKAEDMLEKGDYEYSLPFYGERRPLLVDLVLEPESRIEKKYSDLKWVDGTLVGYAFTPKVKGVGAYLWGVASPIYDIQGKIVGAIESIKDITEQKKMEKALQESKDYLNKIINSIGDPLFVKDRQHRMTLVNDAACKLWGLPCEEIVGKTAYELFSSKEMAEVSWMKDEEVFKTGAEITNEETNKYADKTLTVLVKKTPYTDNAGNQFLVGITRDITDRKLAEDKIIASLQEKEILLKEVHHRVKNNLQIISALLSLQSSNLTDDNIIKIFKDSQNRIKSMALIHENLYRSKDLGKVDFNEYIKQLVSHLSQSYGDLAGKISFKVNSEKVYLNINTAIPCGMIINELVSNSLKYAFPDGREGEISIDLSSEDDGFNMVISDNGIGIKEGLNIKDSKTLGFRLIDTLVKQIDGKMSLDTINGTRCEIHFKGLK